MSNHGILEIGSVSLKNRFGHSGRFDYRKLVIPTLCEIGFVNLLRLDRDEAEFFEDLIYNSGCG